VSKRQELSPESVTMQPSHCFQKTPFGQVAIIWSVHQERPKILRVVLSKQGASAGRLVKAMFPHSISSSCAEVDLVADQITAFLGGDDIRFSLDTARMDLCSTFQHNVLRAEHGIPRGRVSTYQRIAGYLGNVKGARAVGTALANNPFPIIIPCHRAIRSDQTLGGYQGGLEMKRALLEMEGILFDSQGRVVTEKMFY
jgi:methylated-DNA-[protein]-cysteine S-methyltransferase